jgi:CO/xanthine dehydrogenase FAD-binding subunit
MKEFNFYSPGTLEELIAVLDDTGGRLVAGGTDLIPRMRRGLVSSDHLIDVGRISDLHFIREQYGQIVIGALTTHQELVDSTLLQVTLPSLVQAAATVGCCQTRCRGTLGGNIANASPAADTIPPLLTAGASVHLAHCCGERAIALDEFLVGPGITSLKRGEFIHSISYSILSGSWGTAFQKLGLRSGMAISVANAAALIVLDAGGKIAAARLALGSVAPTVVVSASAEAVLLGQDPTPELMRSAAQACLIDIDPISDVRATKDYRKHAATVLARRVLETSVVQARRRKSV